MQRIVLPDAFGQAMKGAIVRYRMLSECVVGRLVKATRSKNNGDGVLDLGRRSGEIRSIRRKKEGDKGLMNYSERWHRDVCRL